MVVNNFQLVLLVIMALGVTIHVDIAVLEPAIIQRDNALKDARKAGKEQRVI